MCNTYFHGAYCDIDERDLLIVADIQGGGTCDIAGGDECRCFVIRTDNPAIEKFQCIVKAFSVGRMHNQIYLV